MAGSKKILVVFTSHTKMIDNDHPTGYYLPEIAHPAYAFERAGYTLDAVSPKGGEAPLDQASVDAFKDDKECQAFLKSDKWQAWVKNTGKLSDVPADGKGYDAIFYPGGHGPCFDLPVDEHSKALIKAFYESGRPTTAVCHAPAVFTDVKLSDGSYLLKGKKATCFTDAEEEQAQLTKAIPWLVESRMVERGCDFSKTKPWGEHVVVDGNLLTGQNPASAGPLAEKIIEVLSKA
ncbi:class I glutamine amidotransferase-like protein [Tilletiopsis washingtonensis]|uniref:D-lactate dehydratase n=1 Tax=Tilletiopsis washingtonensis TaxID=58919 RepID=A0A316Z852_9BASI|nr:class I glutamine amidotransferase-like protein [Tilletiopsis washingtonensis]PWN97751.1 class I glutamine amidotransferase-like protein [Tilletiopsis washingtonensis]